MKCTSGRRRGAETTGYSGKTSGYVLKEGSQELLQAQFRKSKYIRFGFS